MNRLVTRYPVIQWTGPFVMFMVLLVAAPYVPWGQPWESVVRVLVLTLTVLVCSGTLVRTFRVQHMLSSIVLGLAVCALWVAPDIVFPGWRSHWLLQNSITGSITTSIDVAYFSDPLVMTLRIVRAAVLVPIVEELFWRGWLPRWIVNSDWENVEPGRYTTLAFVLTAVLFAAEHGPYWEVGLVCGVVYNWWFWKTKSLGDMVLVHAVTNGALSAFVVATGRYEYWM
jgi:CAAX prenyl protease-like protein